MAMGRPSKYADLPWGQIRREFEGGEALQVLVKRYGISSKTVIQRRIAAEGWQATPRRVARFQTDQAIALAAEATVRGLPPEAVQRPEGYRESIDPESIRKGAALAREMVGMAEMSEAEPLPRAGTAEAHEKAQLDAVGAVAVVHATVIQRQLARANLAQQMGLEIMGHVNALIRNDDPGRCNRILQGLLQVNPNRETLAGIAKVATDILKLGFDTERRALDMEGKKNPAEAVVEAADPDDEPSCGGLFDGLGDGPEVVELMWKTREVMMELDALREKEEIRNRQAKASPVR